MTEPSATSKLIAGWTASRDDAQALLKSLVEAKAQSEQRLAEFDLPDIYREATGRSAIDNAIRSTQRMVDTFTRLIEDASRETGENAP